MEHRKIIVQGERINYFSVNQLHVQIIWNMYINIYIDTQVIPPQILCYFFKFKLVIGYKNKNKQPEKCVLQPERKHTHTQHN